MQVRHFCFFAEYKSRRSGDKPDCSRHCYLLWEWLEPYHGSPGHGPCAPPWPDKGGMFVLWKINLSWIGAFEILKFFSWLWTTGFEKFPANWCSEFGDAWEQVTVYRLICKGTVEEKIVKRASQKNTVQQLVMTGGQSVQGDVLEAEEVVSLLLDDAELEARMREQNSKQVVGFSFQDLLTCVFSLQFLLASWVLCPSPLFSSFFSCALVVAFKPSVNDFVMSSWYWCIRVFASWHVTAG